MNDKTILNLYSEWLKITDKDNDLTMHEKNTIHKKDLSFYDYCTLRVLKVIR